MTTKKKSTVAGKRADSVSEAIALLTSARDIIGDLADEVQEAFDNTP